MRFLPVVVPLLALPFLAGYLDWWRAEASRNAALSSDLVWAQIVSAVTMLILTVSFALTLVWFIRRKWPRVATGIFFCGAGLAAVLGWPLFSAYLEAQGFAGTALSEAVLVMPRDTLTNAAWGMVAAFGVVLLMWDLFERGRLGKAG